LQLSSFISFSFEKLKCTILRQDRLGTDVRKVETKDRFAAQPKELPHWTLELAFPLHGSATHGGAENAPLAPISTTFLMCIPSLFWQIIVLHERNWHIKKELFLQDCSMARVMPPTQWRWRCSIQTTARR
jgi:hypothetical protein